MFTQHRMEYKIPNINCQAYDLHYNLSFSFFNSYTAITMTKERTEFLK